MITRFAFKAILHRLQKTPAVAILGPRQVGKTTLAKSISKQFKKDVLYFDLENPRHEAVLMTDAYTLLEDNKEKLIIIDEIQRRPELFTYLRPLIDDYRKNSRFLLLGSASPQLVKGVSESLAGRIHYADLSPLYLNELPKTTAQDKLWFRGGFPKALLAKKDTDYCVWMDDFIKTYTERDLNDIYGINLPRTVVSSFWKMLAHHHGGLYNAEMFGRSLGITSPTVTKYLDYLEGAFLVRRLPSYFVNAKKRLIKAPKIYIADSGILHRLINIDTVSDLKTNPVVGASWEGFVIEQIRCNLPRGFEIYFYRTQNGAEADLVITKALKPVACIEIKLSNTPKISDGFYNSIMDLETTTNFVITPRADNIKLSKGLTLTNLSLFLSKHQNEVTK
ncbi:MAG: ATP-binding protein [Bacteroidota bacterium]|nr:ATP-binding protein [Bacteroidota bacterium]